MLMVMMRIRKRRYRVAKPSCGTIVVTDRQTDRQTHRLRDKPRLLSIT